ncbi:zinc finger protein 652 isoform X1 [Anabrus simplex]|uniref:zinc finger protein 652 isoform X1 n=1 Tax=Anabrus simplex TaxID=316456 RepID=UPI0035A33314
MEDTVKMKEEVLCPQEPSESPSDDEMLRGEDAVNIENTKTEQPIETVFITEFKREPDESVGNVLKDEREGEEDGPGGTPLSQDQVSPVGNAEIGKKQTQREEDQTENIHRVVMWNICHKEDFMEQMSELGARNSGICEGGVESESAVEKNSTDQDDNGQESAGSTVSCGICNEILENVSVLHKHVKIQHDDRHSANPNSNSICTTLQPIHKCGICCREFKRFGSLYQHAKVHAEDRRTLCKKCSKKFPKCSPLQKREAAHIKDRRFLCSACGKTFFEMHSLKRHMVTHFTEGHHACNICSKSFASYTHLRTHLLTHTAVNSKENLSNVNSETACSCNTCGEHLTY